MLQKHKHRTWTWGIAIAALLGWMLALMPAGLTPRAEAGVTFTFSDSGIAVSDAAATGYKIEGTALTINAAGTYTVTGSCAEGSIKVKKGTTGVILIMSDLTLSCSTTAPLAINKEGAEVTLYVTGENTLISAEDPANETSTDAEIADAFEGAAIKVKSNSSLTIEGDGTLNIDSSACKNGIKAGDEATLIINSGTYNINAANDAIASNADLTIAGGTFTISAGDDAIHADYVTNIGVSGSESGPSITVTKCEEGIEGAVVNLYSGSATVKAADDGINAANSDLTNYAYAINIAGGTWYIDADGDGADSNGDINISGGKTEIFGSVNNGNAAFDYDGNCALTGGSLLAVGYSGMAQAPKTGASVVYSGVSVAKGTQIDIKNSAGETVYSAVGVKAANHVVYSADNLTQGESYTLYLNNAQAGTAVAGTAQTGPSGGFGPGGDPGQGGGGQPFTPPGGGDQPVQQEIGTATVTLASDSYEYDGTAHTPAVTVVLDGRTLMSGMDYTVSYENNVNAGTATVTVTGAGMFTGTVTAEFTITKRVLTLSGMRFEDKYYDGSKYMQLESIYPTVSGIVGDDDVQVCTKRQDYVITGTCSAGAKQRYLTKGLFQLSGDDAANYMIEKGTTATGTIKKVGVTTVTLTKSSASYTGKSKRPSIKLITGNTGKRILIKNCTVTYYRDGKETTDFTSKGTITVVVTGTGSYKGSASATYVIR